MKGYGTYGTKGDFQLENSSQEEENIIQRALETFKRGAIPPTKLAGYKLFQLVSYVYALNEFQKLVGFDKDPKFDSVDIIERENKDFLVYYMKVAEDSEKESYVMIAYYNEEEYIDEFFRTYLEIPKSKENPCSPDFFQIGDSTFIDTNDGIYEYDWDKARLKFEKNIADLN